LTEKTNLAREIAALTAASHEGSCAGI
jgi:hypothetical protein